MAMDDLHAGSTEEGEISDSDLDSGVQRRDTRLLGSKRGPYYASRAWTMCDLYNYSACSGYASGLYNLAWAQAVQNKSLDDVFVRINRDEKPRRPTLKSEIVAAHGKEERNNNVSKEVINVINGTNDYEVGNRPVVDELEEGELEEGEIDMDAEEELIDNTQEIMKDSSNNVTAMDDNPEIQSKTEALMPHNLIPNTLSKLSVAEAKESFLDTCSHIQNTLEEVESVDNSDTRSTLFSAIQTVRHAFNEMSNSKQDRSKCIFLRLLTCVMDRKPPLFGPEQLQEIDVIRGSLDLSSMGTLKPNGEAELNGIIYEDDSGSDMSIENTSSDGIYFNASNSNTTSVSIKDTQSIFSESSKPLISSVKRKGFPGLLVDLHKVHDADSLPSPTRESSVKSATFSTSTCETELLRLGSENSSFASSMAQNPLLHPYETDAFASVSTYQQKFGRTSIIRDKLPSPTPSEEGDVGDGDIGGDVSSSYTGADGSAAVNQYFSMMVDSSNKQSDFIASRIESTNSSINLTAKPSPKSRDPRLRVTDPGIGTSDVNNKPAQLVDNTIKIGSHVEIMASKPLFDESSIKRQRISSENYTWRMIGKNDAEPIRAEMATLPEVELRSENNGMIAADQRVAHEEANITSCLPTIVKDLDPVLLMKLLQMAQQQKLPTESSFTQTVSYAPNTSTQSLKVSQSLPTKQVEDSGKFRMKPRDPRRILHSSTSGTSPATNSLDGMININPVNPSIISAPSVSAPPLDIGSQFIQNLRSITELFSSSHHSKVAPQPGMVGEERVGVKIERNVQKNGACLASDRTLSHNNWDGVEHLLDGYDNEQKVAIQRERARRLDEQRTMFASHKLSLVLDLDHTLLNSAKFNEIDPGHEEILRKKEEQDRENPQRHLYRFVHMGMWTKLRPGIWNFLDKASKLYELHVYTMGNKLYATEMAKILDPNGSLFGGRVLSRGDDGDPFDNEERVPKTKDLEGVLGMESSVLIIDDSVRVWPHNKHNLIVVERYTYFPCSRRQFGLVGPSLLEIDHDERPEDGTLASSLAVVERVHRNFFSNLRLESMDVRNVLAAEQQKILAGCRIVFSRVFPVGEVNPHLHPLWQIAEQFGASCTNQIDERITHVVAISLGTDKVNWAISRGRYVVHPGWVEASALLYRRANEYDFNIKS